MIVMLTYLIIRRLELMLIDLFGLKHSIILFYGNTVLTGVGYEGI